jgi:NADPH:quinone reductase-like Zn-dependent oxidoreductase
MVAVVQRRYGPPSTLHLEDVPVPAPGPGEVLVRVRAASLNAKDWHIMRGEPRIARLNRSVFGARAPRVPTPGTDVAGTVAAVGDGVSRWAPGDVVVGEGIGTFAQYALAPAEHLAAVPDGVTPGQAAALPLAATTAALCIDEANPGPGRTILVNGASGGVGTFALQLAAQRRMHVTAVVSPRNVAQAERLGAATVIDYTTHDFTRGVGQYDAVLDLVGNRPLTCF